MRLFSLHMGKQNFICSCKWMEIHQRCSLPSTTFFFFLLSSDAVRTFPTLCGPGEVTLCYLTSFLILNHIKQVSTLIALQIKACCDLLVKSTAVQHFKWNCCIICVLKMQVLRSERSQSLAASPDLRGRLLTVENVRCYYYSYCARRDFKISYFNSCLFFRGS